MNKIAVKTSLFFLVLITLSAASLNAQTTGQGTVLLLRDSSDFKDLLAEEIAVAADESGMAPIVEDSLKGLKKADLDNYSGLIIISTGMAGRMKRSVRNVLENPGSLPRIVVVTTYGSPASSRDKYPEHPSVDGITSASLSDPGEIRSLGRKIVSFLIN